MPAVEQTNERGSRAAMQNHGMLSVSMSVTLQAAPLVGHRFQACARRLRQRQALSLELRRTRGLTSPAGLMRARGKQAAIAISATAPTSPVGCRVGRARR